LFAFFRRWRAGRARQAGLMASGIQPKSILEETMAKSVSVIGIDPGELGWVRLLLFLLRHPDTLTSRMVQQALIYLAKSAHEHAEPGPEPRENAP
jgi:hypothetical protein